jgi:Helix-turn-helix domain/RodZ C-terminal domain
MRRRPSVEPRRHGGERRYRSARGNRDVPEKTLHFGRQLERTRREKKISLPEASAALCIRRDFLAALEREDLKAFQSRAYAIGFLKAYSDFLALDPAPMVLSLKKKFGPEPAYRIDPGSLPRKRGILPVLAIAILLALGAAAAWFGWQYWRAHQAAAGPNVADAAARSGPIAEASAAVRPAAFLANGTASFFRDMIATASLRVVALGEARVAVRDADGQVLREGVLYPGEGIDLPLGRGLALLTPEQGALAFFLDGRRAAVPAEAEDGLARLPLDQAALPADPALPAS